MLAFCVQLADRSRRMLPGVLVLAAGFALGLSSPALADPNNAGQPPLGGPRVKDNRAPGAEGRFGGGDNTNKARLNPRLDIRMYREALRKALGPDAPENVRMSDDQRSKVQAIVQGFEGQMRAYMDQHKEELKQLREAAGMPPGGRGGPGGPGGGEGGGPGGKRGGKRGHGDGEGQRPPPPQNGPDADHMTPPPPPPHANVDPEVAKAAHDQMRTIMEGAPKPEGLVNQVWQVLSADQKKAVETTLEDLKKTRASERADEYVDRKARKKADGAAGAAGAPGDGTPAKKGRPGGKRPGSAPAENAPGNE